MLSRLRLFRSFSALKKDLKPSLFTGKADFYETLYFLDDVVIQLKDLNPLTNPNSIDFNWLNRENLQNKLGFEMSLLEYRQIRQRLSKIQQAASLSPNILEFLRVFGEAVRTESLELMSEEHSKLELKKESSLGMIDELGRAVAVGRRKSSTCKVTLLPGTGEFRVNGKPLVDYFVKPRYIYDIAKPFQIADSFGKYNVWALVKGGGSTGQCGAISLGLAKALAVYNPSVKESLDAAGCLRRDPRSVERKKPGQEKARKKFTWVKR